MKKKLLTAFFLAALLVSVSYASAEDIDSVIVATDESYPDALVSGAAGNNVGAPVLLTGEDALDDETESELDELGDDDLGTVYIIGGPEVVGEMVENQLRNKHKVVRIWGFTRYGTSAKIAMEFWDTAPKALLVWDVLGNPSSGNPELLAEARDLAMQENLPVLLIQKDGIPDAVVDALGNLSTETVILVGDVGSAVTDTLDELGITVEEHLKGDDVNATRERVRDKIRERIQEKVGDKPLVVAAIGDWSDAIKAPYRPNGTSRHITSEEQIDDLVDEINENNYSRILIVGKPELAQAVYDRLSEEGIESTLVSGRAAAVAKEVAKKDREKLRERADAVRERLREMQEERIRKRLNETDGLIQRAQDLLERARVAEAMKTRVVSELREMKRNIDANVTSGNYEEAWRLYNKLKDESGNMLTYENRERLENAYRAMLNVEKTLVKTVQDLREIRSLRESD